MDTLRALRANGALEARLRGFETWSLPQLIEYSIGSCHQPAKKEISIIYDIAHVVRYKHSDRYPQLGKLSEALFLSFDNLLRHLRMEASTFFPIIGGAFRKAGHPDATCKTIPEYIAEMAGTLQKVHADIVKDFEIFRELTACYTIPGDDDFLFRYLFQKMKRLEKEITFQMHLENAILFPKAIALAKELNKQGCRPNAFWRGGVDRFRV